MVFLTLTSYLSNMMTVSAACRLSPTPPALRLSINKKVSEPAQALEVLWIRMGGNTYHIVVDCICPQAGHW